MAIHQNSLTTDPSKEKRITSILYGDDDDEIDDDEDADTLHLTKEQYQHFMNLVKHNKEEYKSADRTIPVQSNQSSSIANVAGTCLITCLNSKWIIDSRTINHICSNLELFATYQPFDKEPSTIAVANGKRVEVKHIGTVKLENGITLDQIKCYMFLTCTLI